MAGARIPGPKGGGPETPSKLPDTSTLGGWSHAGPLGGDFACTDSRSRLDHADSSPVVRQRSRFVFRGEEYRLTSAEWVGRRHASEEPITPETAHELLPKMADDGIRVGLEDLNGQSLLEAIRRGLVVLLRARAPTAAAAAAPGAAPAAAPASRRPVKDGWIEIEVKDEQGRHRAGDAYKLELPDGRIFTGIVSSSGIIGFHGIDPGSAKFSLTSVDAARWS